jgi:hypothetical protein
VPRLSLWKDGKHTADYKFFDQRINEMFTIGGVGINVHKYLGPNAASGETGDLADATQPNYTNQSEKNIQDFLFLENRDRKYDTSIYNMRGVYQPQSQDFDLSQFGLLNANDTLYIVFHHNEMVDILGRKIMNGDVLELQNLIDYEPLDDDLPATLKRYYVVSDATRASEGFSASWWSHLWRVKVTPLVDSQEYKDIINKINGSTDEEYNPEGTDTSLSDLLSQYNKNIEINDAIIAQAEEEVPESGYDTSRFYVVPTDENGKALNPKGKTSDDTSLVSDDSENDTSNTRVTPSRDQQGYLVGDGLAPNGFPVSSGTTFPTSPVQGDFALRLDYKPNRLFRYDGTRWVKVEDDVRTNLTPGASNQTQRSGFVNNSNTYTTVDGKTYEERQGLSDVLTAKADNE